MPTLRDDFKEARSRADVERKMLAEKLAKGEEWSRQDKIDSIDGFDSLVTAVNEALPYIPDGVTRSGEGSVTATGGSVPDIVPAKSDRLAYGTHFTFGGQTLTQERPDYRIGGYAHPIYPKLPDGYDKTRPNIVVDGGRGTFNFEGVDWSGDTAGTTERLADLWVQVETPVGQWGDILVWTMNDSNPNHVITEGRKAGVKLEFRGGAGLQQAKLQVRLSGPPQAGGRDWFQVYATFIPYEDEKSFQVSGGQVIFGLPKTRFNPYRDVIAVRQGGIDSISSIDRLSEKDGILSVWGTSEVPRAQYNADGSNLYGVWFDRREPNYHIFKVVSALADYPNIYANSLSVGVGPNGEPRLYVMRDGNVEGWINGRDIVSVRMVG